MASILPKIPIPVPVKGVQADLARENVPPDALAEAENVIRRNGEFGVRPGLTTIFADLNERPTGYIQFTRSDASEKIVKATVNKWWALDAAAWVDITDALIPLTGGPSHHQIFRTFELAGATWLLGVNGKDAMKKWDGNVANDYANVGGSPPIAKAMVLSFDHVLLGNLLSGGTVSPLAVDISASGDFNSGWGATLTNLLADTAGAIMVMLEMGNLLTAIYKTDAVYLAIAQESKDPFRFEMKRAFKEEEDGIASAATAVALSEGTHLLMVKNGGFKIFDGGVVLRDLPYRIQRHVAKTANFSAIERSWLYYDSSRKETYAIYPLLGSNDPNGGIMINMTTLEFYPLRWTNLKFSAGGKINTQAGLTIGQLPGTIGSITQTIGELGSSNEQNKIVFGEIGGQTYQESGTLDGVDTIPFFWEGGLSDVGNGTRFKTVQEIQHRFKRASAAQQINVELGLSDYGEERVLQASEAIDIGNAGPYRTEHRKSAKSASLRYSGNGSKEIVYKGSDAAVAQRGLK